MVYSTEWYHRNKESLDRARKKYNAKNREIVRKHNILQSQKSSYGDTRENILKIHDRKCANCETTENLHIHHIDGNGSTKLAKDKNNNPDNIKVLCRSCHMREDAKRRMKDNVCIICSKKSVKLSNDLCRTCYEKTRKEYKKEWYKKRKALDK